MRTFFAQVHDLTKEESENDLVLWIGDNYDEIKSLKGLIEAIAEYAVIPEDILA